MTQRLRKAGICTKGTKQQYNDVKAGGVKAKSQRRQDKAGGVKATTRRQSKKSEASRQQHNDVKATA